MTGNAATGTGVKTLAPHHLRLFALIVDYLLAVVLVNLSQKAFVGAHWDLRPVSAGTEWPWWGFVAGMMFLLVKDGAGRSPGKYITGIAVGRADDPASVPDAGRLIMRNLSLVLLPLEAVWVFFDPYARRLGDRWAGTIVVVPAKTAPVTRRLLGLTILFLATMLAIFLTEFWNVRRSAAYQTAIRIAASHPLLSRAIGDGLEFFGSPALTRSGTSAQEWITVILDAEGEKGKARVEVVLRLAGAPPHWELDSFTLLERPPPPVEAKPAPPR